MSHITGTYAITHIEAYLATISGSLDQLERFVLATEDIIALRIAQRRIDRICEKQGHAEHTTGG